MSQIDDFLSGKLTPEAPSSIDEFLGVAPKKKRRDVADMTSGSVAQDIASGVLQIGPTAVKGVADIARLATGDRVGTDTSEAMERGMASIRDTIGSGRAAAQRENFQADMADDEVGIGETLTRNKGALADQLLPTIGSMFLPVGVAGAAGKLATVGKAAQAMDKATLVARVASAQQAAGIGAVAAQNAADTFAQLLEKGAPLEDAYLGAGITVPFSVIAGRLTGGGAEGAITRALTGGAAAKAGVKQLGTAMLKEGGQEMGEEAGQITGEAVAMGEAPSAMGAAKQLAVAGTLGAAMGGGVDVATQSGKFGKPAEVPPAAAPPAITPETGSTPADQAPPAAVITPQSGAADPTTQLAQFELLREQRDLTPEERAQVVDLLTALNEQEATGDANQATPVQPGEQAPDAGAASMDATQQGATAGPAGPGAVDGAGQSEQAQPLSTESAARQIPDKSPAFEEVQAQQPELDVTGRPPASWVIKEKATGNVILETFDKAKVDALNTDKYEAIPIGKHLASLNKPAPVTQQLAIEQVQPTRPPTDFWSFAKSKGFTPSQITIGSPEHAALKAEYDALKAGNAAPVLPPMQPQQNVDLQNRDRGRAASVVQMSEIARNPDYMRLGPSRTPDSGAPMVFAVGGQLSIAPQNLGREDVAVMSDGQRVPFRYAVVDASTVNPSNFADGRQNPAFASTAPGTLKALNNGRTAGVRAAHEMGAAADYVGGMKADEAMHGIPADVIARTPNPMLVRVYADADNTAGMAAKSQGQGLGMSPTELARQDAPLLDSSVLGVYADGEVTSAGNRDFVRAFIGKLQGSGQDVAGMITGDGQLSQDGRKRIQAALMQAAYGDSNIVEEMFDSTDTDIKAIGEALKAVAGRWANMRDSARLGAISPEVDITQNLLQAIGLIRKARRDNTGLFDLVNQPDLMTGETPDAMTVGMLRLFYSGKYLTRAIGKDKLAQHLGDYMTGAMATSADAGMFGDVVTPADILATIINRITQGQGNAETQPQESREQPAGGIPAGRGAGEGGQAVGRPGAAEGRDGPDQDSAGQPGQDAQAGTEQQAGAGNQKAEEGDGAAEGRAGGGQQAEPGAAEPRPVAPKRANPAAKKTPKNTDPVAAIKPWRDRFEAAKTANDKDAIQSLHDKVRVYLNGPAQARGEAVVAQFEALRSDIEQFAEDVKTAAATAIQSSAEGKKDYKTTTTEAGPLLTAPTEAEVVARQDSADAAKRRAEADKRRADEEERTRRERADIAQASVAAADTFELGQDAMANPTGQQDIFGAPAEPAAPDAEQATGPFGPILTQFRGDAQGAIKALTKLQDGEAVAALNHPEVGDIDLVWGKEGTSNSDGLGLAKLAKRHPEVLGDLQGFLNSLRKDEESSGKNRIRLIGDNGKAVVRLQWDGKAKAWLLTAFENAPKGSTTTDTGTADVGGDTASPNPERNASVPLTTDEAQGKPATVENFGEKLPPARRAMAAKLSEDLTDDKIASMPLSQIWPATENDAIEDTFAAAVAHVMREAIPAKPRTPYKVKSWVGKVRLLRGFAADIMSGKVAKEKFVAEMGKLYTLKDILSKIKLLEQIDRADWARIGDVSEAPNAVRYEDNKQIPTPSVSVTVDGRNHWLRGSGDVADHLDGIKAMLGTAAPENKMQFEIRQESRGDRKVFINKKGDKEYRRLMTFDTVADARAAVSNQYTELVAAWEGVKSRDNITERDVRSDVNRDRTGKDHRKGKDVSAEDFESRFGFRGGEFGKWVKQGDGAKERQFLLNNAYDALMDLSDLLGIPPKAISLEGTLGIAFGSRGSGGAAAHFEPSNLVINLTKTRGAGSLAHEWFHALDNYFARKRGGEVPMDAAGQVGYRNNNYITHKTTPLMVRKDGRGSPLTKERLAQWRSQSPNSGYLAEDQWHEDPKHKAGVRVKVEQAFNDLVAALNSSPMLKRARVLDGVKESGDGYWSRTLEMAARSFENFVQTRMMEQGYHNDFLANVKAAPDVGKNTERYPYLMPNEIAPIASAFDGLFGTIQAKETADGNISLLSRGTATGGVAPKALESLVDGIRTKNPNLPKVNVLADPSQAPRGLREYINRQNAWGDVEGAMHDGELYLFASGLSDLARAEHVLIQHEAAHYGLRAVLGDKLTTAMNLVYANNGKVRKAATELQKRGKLTDAEAAEEVIVDIPTSELAKLTGWRKVVAMASEWLGAHGYNRTAQKLADWLDGSLTDQQRADLFVAELVQGARDYVAGKRPGAMDTGGTRLSAVSDTSMRKYPGTTNFDAIANSVLPSNARSDAGDVRIVYLDESQSQGRSNSGSRLSRATLGGQPVAELPAETVPQYLQRRVQDNLNRFTVIKEWLAEQGISLPENADVHKAEERMHSKFANKAEDFRQKRLNPLIQRTQKAGFTLEDVAQFLHAQHAEERNKQVAKVNQNRPDGGSGMTTADANKILAAAPAGLKAIANEFRQIAEDTKNRLLKAGIVPQDMVDAWEGAYKFYVPLKGGPDTDVAKGTGKGLSVKNKQKRALGHEMREEGEWIIENIAADHERALMLVEKNVVGLHLLLMAATAGRDDLITIGKPKRRQVLRNQSAYVVQKNGVQFGVYQTEEAAKLARTLAGVTGVTISKTNEPSVVLMAAPQLQDNEVNVYLRGMEVRLQINDELLARAYKNMGDEALGAILSAGRTLNTYFSKIYTGYNPEFIQVNLIRDFATGLMNVTGEEGFAMAVKAARNYPKRFVELFKYARTNNETNWVKMYREDGGNTGAAYLSDMERLGSDIATEYAVYQGFKKNLDDMRAAQTGKDKMKAGWLAARAAGRKVFEKTLVWVERLNQAGENAMRLSVYQAMIESGKTRNEAASLAKNATVNFNRKGELGKQANALYLFFNAGVQGTAAIAHSHMKGKYKGQARALSGSLVALGYLASLFAAAGDEDEYEEVSEFERTRNMLIDTGDGFAKIPVPYGYGFFFNAGRVIADAQRTGEAGKLPWHLATSMIQEFTPFGNMVAGSAPDGKQAFIYSMPTVGQIAGAPLLNRTGMGGPMMPESAFDPHQPDRDKMWRQTRGSMSDTIAGALEAAGLDVSPETLKHYGRTFTGGAGTFLTSVGDGMHLALSGAELETSEIPFLRKMYMVPDVRGARARYNESKNEVTKYMSDYRRAVKAENFDLAEQIATDNQEMLIAARMSEGFSKMASAQRDMIDNIRLKGRYTKAEERVLVKELEVEEREIYREYLDRLKGLKQEHKERAEAR